MKFGVLTINNGRQRILKLFGESILRSKRGVNIKFPVICVSGIEDKPICSHYDIEHITYPNSPATYKWNIGMERMRQLDLDYVIILGSDDIVSTDAFINIITAMEAGHDLIGFTTIYVYDVDGRTRGQLRRLDGRSMFGVGKTIHRSILDKVNWQPWEYSAPRNWGMDAIVSRNTNPHVTNRAIVEGMIVDCKTKENLNKFSMFISNKKGYVVDNKLFFDFLSEEEKQILCM